MKQANFARARERLVESLRLEASAGTLINLALCEEKLGMLNDSLRRLREANALADGDERRQALVAKLVRALEPRVPRLVIEIDGQSPGVEVTLDGEKLDLAAGRRELEVNPGHHAIVLREPDGHLHRFDAHVDEGDNKPMVLRVPPRHAGMQPPSPDALEQREPPPPSKTSAQLGAVALGAGGLGLVAGMVTGFMTLGRKVKVDHHCDANGCDAEGQTASEEGAALGTVSTIATASGLAGIGLGGYLLLRGGVPATDDALGRRFGYGAALAGGLALATSAVTASAALSAERQRQDNCDATGCRNPEGVDATSRGRAYSTVSTVAFGVGLAGLGVASYSLLFRPLFKKAPDSQLSLSPSGVTCTTKF